MSQSAPRSERRLPLAGYALVSLAGVACLAVAAAGDRVRAASALRYELTDTVRFKAFGHREAVTAIAVTNHGAEDMEEVVVGLESVGLSSDAVTPEGSGGRCSDAADASLLHWRFAAWQTTYTSRG